MSGAAFEGGCLCGAVRYRATGPARFATLCHCASCRRAAGAPAVAWVSFAADAFTVTRGEPARFRSSPPVVRGFCGGCGSQLTYVHSAFPALVDVTTASLDEPARCAPLDHTWTSERLPWWRPEPRWPDLLRSRVEGARGSEVEVIGLDHVYLTVTDLARARAFYDAVLGALDFERAEEPIDGDPHVHYWNRALQISIRPARTAGLRADAYAPGLHHLCLQLRDAAAVDAACALLRALGVRVTAPRLYPEYNPDYYASFLEDPDGIRLELVARKARRDEIVAGWKERGEK
jgi:catechol 2,3-dioxygenase-like lactoylglutathione lyase family enzyme